MRPVLRPHHSLSGRPRACRDGFGCATELGERRRLRQQRLNHRHPDWSSGRAAVAVDQLVVHRQSRARLAELPGHHGNEVHRSGEVLVGPRRRIRVVCVEEIPEDEQRLLRPTELLQQERLVVIAARPQPTERARVTAGHEPSELGERLERGLVTVRRARAHPNPYSARQAGSRSTGAGESP